MEAKSLEVIAADIRARTKPGDRIVFISGDFNVIHPGHLRIINFAASCGDFLVIGVNADGLGHSHIHESLRVEAVQSIGVVNYAFILRSPPEEAIARIQPDTVVKGREHSRFDNPEKEVVESYGGKLLFASGDVQFSSLDLLRKELYEANFSSIRLPQDYPQRHGFAVADLVSIVHKFSQLNVVVVGDLIVDEYIDCEPLGMSREDPTLVVMPILSEQFVGGAGIVAAHARGMGATVSYFGVAAQDAASAFAAEKLAKYGVTCHLLYDDTRPTTLKQRYRATKKTLLRVSHLRQHDISPDLVDEMFAKMVPALEKADLLLFSDFNYGCLPQSLVDRVSEYCRQRAIPMAADSQASSQIGDVSRYRNMQLLTPTEHEARLALRDFQSGLIVLADGLAQQAQSKYVILTLAGEGIVVYWPDEPSTQITDQLPAFNHAPKDVSGAGDCLFTCAAMALTGGATIWTSAYLGSIAAACQVSRMGNSPLTAAELIEELSS
jgi:rfaE bifunctional protein kinase chain/domain